MLHILIVAFGLSLAQRAHGLSCLVARPGYGLVSERCPSGSVGCRIKVDHNAIQFYQYSALYDRNQLVCIYKNEYGLMEQSGCVQRKAGRTRCWCVHGDDCNTPEYAKQLYENFKDGDKFDADKEKNEFEEIKKIVIKEKEEKHKTRDVENKESAEKSKAHKDAKHMTGKTYDGHKGNKKTYDKSFDSTKSTKKTKEVLYDSYSTDGSVKTESKHHHGHHHHKHSHKHNEETTTTTLASIVFPADINDAKVIRVNSKDSYQNFIGSDKFKEALVEAEPIEEQSDEPYDTEEVVFLPSEEAEPHLRSLAQFRPGAHDLDDIMEPVYEFSASVLVHTTLTFILSLISFAVLRFL
ncbi:unnamed protein product [Bursaphelenchus okinawaensis]|uniref:Uncharacterized protein n=1 Tax=Bursaphelenchus okinawaensis TaxID=465554 RepID=A0A811JUV4_9BILA|nr:unnamed protein product [Bursaphelenchus okinawaensis]CAG9084297.1 unnamed protein product [Bursaphelenchus okinawaensis]